MAHTVDFIYFILTAPTSIALHREALYLICAFWVQDIFQDSPAKHVSAQVQRYRKCAHFVLISLYFCLF